MTDQEQIEAYIAKHGVTRIENGQWPYPEVQPKKRFNPGFASNIRAAQAKSVKANVERAARRLAALAAEFSESPTLEHLKQMAANINVSPTHMRAMLKRAGVENLPGVGAYIPKRKRA